MRLNVKKLCTWLLMTACILGFGHQLSATTTNQKSEPLRIVYIGGINGYLNLCG